VKALTSVWRLVLIGLPLVAALNFQPTSHVLAMDRAADLLISDSFTGGKPELDWVSYSHFNHDNLHGALDPTSPEGEPGVGVLDNKSVGGFAALSYANTQAISDFYLEAWLYVQVVNDDKGPLNGIAFRIEPAAERFYRLASHFAEDSFLSLAYVGKDSNNFPIHLAQWKAAELPGGRPAQSAWHQVAIEVKNDEAQVYWDSHLLPGGPFRLERIGSGYIGAYANYTGGLGLAETKLDGLRVWRKK
jgi:hypothetical protein